jgi:hypothetical protein
VLVLHTQRVGRSERRERGGDERGVKEERGGGDWQRC